MYKGLCSVRCGSLAQSVRAGQTVRRELYGKDEAEGVA